LREGKATVSDTKEVTIFIVYYYTLVVERRVHTGFWWGTLRERDHLEDPDIDGGLILRWIFRKWDGRLGLIDLAQDRDRWRLL
jgi:hypothetical protein